MSAIQTCTLQGSAPESCVENVPKRGQIQIVETTRTRKNPIRLMGFEASGVVRTVKQIGGRRELNTSRNGLLSLHAPTDWRTECPQ